MSKTFLSQVHDRCAPASTCKTHLTVLQDKLSRSGQICLWDLRHREGVWCSASGYFSKSAEQSLLTNVSRKSSPTQIHVSLTHWQRTSQCAQVDPSERPAMVGAVAASTIATMQPAWNAAFSTQPASARAPK